MASSLFMNSCKVLLLLALLSSFNFLAVVCVEFQVGGDKGWVIPPSKNSHLYNDWASKNRFKGDDTLRFEYKKDSVLVVTQEEYEKCRSSHPMFFSNNGNTVYKLDQPGLFYFISGVAGHCERGLKMIIKVLELESPSQSANQTTNSKSSQKSGALPMAGATYSPTTVMIFTSLFGALFA
ncbi:hypothetical protein RJ639_044391 [Escallonia herrerae]|uniref:Phytocyanin domain-containing protein n=1 Tax=Escallonia herrerae TaxID=1293975 RepID=A0AA89B8B0_9ASTE|nr:hypothetical protein RJ639_044391 [Escallonia herrerae]